MHGLWVLGAAAFISNHSPTRKRSGLLLLRAGLLRGLGGTGGALGRRREDRARMAADGVIGIVWPLSLALLRIFFVVLLL